MTISFEVNRGEYASTRVVESETPLSAGQVLARIEHFAVTSNNVTYATIGDALGYWNFFPADEGWGRVPAFGFAEIEESRCDDVAVGRRVYGYWPMANVYNTYSYTKTDPKHQPDREAQQMLLFPLFYTGFVVDDLFDDQGFYGADAVVLSSASSKTAIATAHLIASRPGIRTIGLTSARNADFVSSLGCYDEVVTYDTIAEIPVQPTVYADFSGSPTIRFGVHRHLADSLVHSTLIGGTHWDDVGGTLDAGSAPGPSPEFFFAPSQIAKRTEEWGRREPIPGSKLCTTAAPNRWRISGRRCLADTSSLQKATPLIFESAEHAPYSLPVKDVADLIRTALGRPSDWMIRRPSFKPVRFGAHWIGPPVLLATIVVSWIPFRSADGVRPFAGLAQYMGAVSIMLMAWSFILAIRAKPLEMMFGGLDRMYRIHRWCGSLSVVFMTIHLANGSRLRHGINGPAIATANTARDMATVGAVMLYALVGVSLLRLIPYRYWRWTHKLLGIPFAFGSWHFYTAAKPYANGSPWGRWFTAFMVVGMAAYILRIFGRNMILRGLRYKVTSVEHSRTTTELLLEPAGRRRDHRGPVWSVPESASLHS